MQARGWLGEFVGGACVLAACAWTIDARAQQDPRAAYERGAAAFAAHEYAKAAIEFAEADRIAPNPTALTSALTAATAADDAVLGMELVERAEARGAAIKKSAAAQAARQKFQARAGKLRVDCAQSHPCTAKLDGADLPVGVERWALVGSHRVEIAPREGAGASYDVTVTAAATLAFKAPAPAPLPTPTVEPPPTAPSGIPSVAPPIAPSSAPIAAPLTAAPAPLPARAAGGLHPAFFFAGLGLTAVAGAITTWSGVDTLKKHDDWSTTGDPATNQAGRDAQTRTNVALAVTAALGVTTAALGLFAVRWSSPKTEIAASWSGSSASLLGRF